MEINHSVLIVEDSEPIRRFLNQALKAENWQVFECDSVARALIETASRQPSLVLLDLGLTDQDGKEYIKEVRQWSNVPILILTARHDEEEKVAALDMGADDYITKPFGIPELFARMRAQLRRIALPSVSSVNIFQFGPVCVDFSNRCVKKGDAEVHLTPIEYKLLGELIKNVGRVCTQRQLLLAVWGPNYIEQPHYLRIYMGHLRQKLEDNPTNPKFLLTEVGIGYRLISKSD
ncbi:response regulator [Commensalibacter oyaizuii]|uniref:Response regulator n=1 Tax=Commensalibacter oyaizuii TaxID=3043873 RepID=A0ABT6PZG0_9PROT|nr:response regulator [Commensalibacter sp. TBRC 16381]MDI2090100.1 response regulator [Commensalibacter sp. TBRC 16381]